MEAINELKQMITDWQEKAEGLTPLQRATKLEDDKEAIIKKWKEVAKTIMEKMSNSELKQFPGYVTRSKECKAHNIPDISTDVHSSEFFPVLGQLLNS